MLSDKLYNGTNHYVEANPAMRMWEWIDYRLEFNEVMEWLEEWQLNQLHEADAPDLDWHKEFETMAAAHGKAPERPARPERREGESDEAWEKRVAEFKQQAGEHRKLAADHRKKQKAAAQAAFRVYQHPSVTAGSRKEGDKWVTDPSGRSIWSRLALHPSMGGGKGGSTPDSDIGMPTRLKLPTRKWGASPETKKDDDDSDRRPGDDEADDDTRETAAQSSAWKEAGGQSGLALLGHYVTSGAHASTAKEMLAHAKKKGKPITAGKIRAWLTSHYRKGGAGQAQWRDASIRASREKARVPGTADVGDEEGGGASDVVADRPGRTKEFGRAKVARERRKKELLVAKMRAQDKTVKDATPSDHDWVKKKLAQSPARAQASLAKGQLSRGYNQLRKAGHSHTHALDAAHAGGRGEISVTAYQRAREKNKSWESLPAGEERDKAEALAHKTAMRAAHTARRAQKRKAPLPTAEPGFERRLARLGSQSIGMSGKQRIRRDERTTPEERKAEREGREKEERQRVAGYSAVRVPSAIAGLERADKAEAAAKTAAKQQQASGEDEKARFGEKGSRGKSPTAESLWDRINGLHLSEADGASKEDILAKYGIESSGKKRVERPKKRKQKSLSPKQAQDAMSDLMVRYGAHSVEGAPKPEQKSVAKERGIDPTTYGRRVAAPLRRHVASTLHQLMGPHRAKHALNKFALEDPENYAKKVEGLSGAKKDARVKEIKQAKAEHGSKAASVLFGDPMAPRRRPIVGPKGMTKAADAPKLPRAPRGTGVSSMPSRTPLAIPDEPKRPVPEHRRKAAEIGAQKRAEAKARAAAEVKAKAEARRKAETAIERKRQQGEVHPADQGAKAPIDLSAMLRKRQRSAVRVLGPEETDELVKKNRAAAAAEKAATRANLERLGKKATVGRAAMAKKGILDIARKAREERLRGRREGGDEGVKSEAFEAILGALIEGRISRKSASAAMEDVYASTRRPAGVSLLERISTIA